MKKYTYILFAFSILFFPSCEEEFLDVVPDNIAVLDNAFSNRNAAAGYLATCYSYMPSEGSLIQDPAMLSGDELIVPISQQDNFAGSLVSNGFLNPSNVLFNYWGVGTPSDQTPNSLYRGIRDCNIFLENIDRVRDLQTFEKSQWVAEVKFLKAYYHFYLARMFGPIIIVDENIPVSEDLARESPVRNTIDETFNYIVNLIDEAIEGLPTVIQPADLGRVSKPAAAGIKARILMEYASPLFNGNTTFNEFVNTEGVPFFPQTFEVSKWERAAQACKEAIDLCLANGIEIYPATYNSIRDENEFTILKAGLRGRVTDPWNEELIWGASSNNSVDLQRRSQSLNQPVAATPIIQRNLAVTLRMAELYYSNNGVPIDEDITWDYPNRYKLKTSETDDALFVAEGETTVNLHFGREPRFYSDLSFDRSIWFGNGTDEEFVVEWRKNETNNRKNENTAAITGYQAKKLVGVRSTLNVPQRRFSPVLYPFPIMRLSDLYLLYAEALNEANGPTAEVYNNVDIIRERANLGGVLESWQNFSNNPNKPMTQEGMRDIIKQERLIELAFEGRRYWDLRRWLELKDLMNTPIRGWNLDGDSNTGAPEIFYQVTQWNTRRISLFEERDYFWPISLSEIINLSNLKQNPGW